MTDTGLPPAGRGRPMISARAAARRPLLGRGLLMAGALFALAGVVMAFFSPWSELTTIRNQMRLRATTEEPLRFLAPGSATFELPPGRIFVSYFTDTELDGTRHIASAELVFELVVTDAEGRPVDVEVEVTQRANLPSSRPGRSSTAVLVGAATLEEAGTYRIDLELGANEAGTAVADVFLVDDKDVDQLERAFAPVLATICGLVGGGFLAMLGVLTRWMEKRTRM
ncbi:MAG: hypothetical protein CMJ34_00880 [Phycisphaerae bacterium]|nr:hypothetical protein [Phycisphaerae bacterium]